MGMTRWLDKHFYNLHVMFGPVHASAMTSTKMEGEKNQTCYDEKKKRKSDPISSSLNIYCLLAMLYMYLVLYPE